MQNVIIIGGNRGIGLGFVKQYLAMGYSVVATYREPSTLDALNALREAYPETLSLHQLEITNLMEVQTFATSIREVDILVLNAGIKGYPKPGTKPPENNGDELMRALQVNTIAHDNLIRAFYDKLKDKRDACIVYMTSLVGQTADNGTGGYHPYRISKAAANAMIWNWSIALMEYWDKNHITDLMHTPCAFAICPGWVKTDMGGAAAKLSVEESVDAMIEVIRHVIKTKECNALYLYNGDKKEIYAKPLMLKEILPELLPQPALSLPEFKLFDRARHISQNTRTTCGPRPLFMIK